MRFPEDANRACVSAGLQSKLHGCVSVCAYNYYAAWLVQIAGHVCAASLNIDLSCQGITTCICNDSYCVTEQQYEKVAKQSKSMSVIIWIGSKALAQRYQVRIIDDAGCFQRQQRCSKEHCNSCCKGYRSVFDSYPNFTAKAQYHSTDIPTALIWLCLQSTLSTEPEMDQADFADSYLWS